MGCKVLATYFVVEHYRESLWVRYLFEQIRWSGKKHLLSLICPNIFLTSRVSHFPPIINILFCLILALPTLFWWKRTRVELRLLHCQSSHSSVALLSYSPSRLRAICISWSDYYFITWKGFKFFLLLIRNTSNATIWLAGWILFWSLLSINLGLSCRSTTI